jgi:hypothetical protein
MRVTNQEPKAIGAGAVRAGLTLMLNPRLFPSYFTQSLMSSVDASRLLGSMDASQLQSSCVEENNFDKTSELGFSCNPTTDDCDDDNASSPDAAQLPASTLRDTGASAFRPVGAAPGKSALLHFNPEAGRRERRWRMCCFVSSL